MEKRVCSENSYTTSHSIEKVDKDKRRQVAKVWNFFRKSSDKKFAKYLTCGKEYKTSGNTSNFRDHLNRFHPGIGKDGDNTSAFSSARSSTRSLSPFCKRRIKYSENSQRKNQLHKALTMMIATDCY